MDEFDICTLSESENKILDYDVFDNYYKIRSKYGYNEELNNNIKKEMEAMLNGILITENDYNKEKEKNAKLLEEGHLNFNKLQENHNKEKEEAQLYYNKSLEEIQLNYNLLKEEHNNLKEEHNNLKEEHNKIDELLLNFDKNFEYKNMKRKLVN
jgi:hypothetical protein